LVRISKGAVGGGVYTHRHRMGFQDATLGVPDVDHRTRTTGIRASGSDDIPLRVQAHAIDAPLRPPVVLAELMQHDVTAQGAIGQNVVGSELPSLRASLDYIEGALVRRDQEAVSPSRIVGHPFAYPGAVGLWICPQDRIMVEHLALAGVDIPSIPGIAEP